MPSELQLVALCFLQYNSLSVVLFIGIVLLYQEELLMYCCKKSTAKYYSKATRLPLYYIHILNNNISLAPKKSRKKIKLYYSISLPSNILSHCSAVQIVC